LKTDIINYDRIIKSNQIFRMNIRISLNYYFKRSWATNIRLNGKNYA